MNQHQLMLVLIAVVAIAAIAVVAFLVEQKRRSQKLRERFGPEYDRVVKQEGTIRQGEEVLQFRAAKREKLKIHPLSPSTRSEFAERWRTTQSRFVDDPRLAVADADGLVSEVMQARGYPMGEFEQQASLISVDHPVVVNNYRSAHEIAERHSRGQASTEDLRQAMVYYRSLFDELLEEPIPQRKGA
jgi:FtsZ-interacting cell division protein ZipA